MDQYVPFCLWLGLVALALLGIWSLIGLARHIRLARATNLPFVILPCSMLGAPWQLVQFIVISVANLIPDRLTRKWRALLVFNDIWRDGYKPFEHVKADTFLVVSPGKLILFTCDPDVTTQFFRDGRFGKPTELISVLNIYGPTMTGTNGEEARLYRKITAPFFSEKTLRRVFTQSISGATRLLEVLTRPNAHRHLRTLSAKLSLNILNQICFGNQNDSDLEKELKFQDNVPDGRTLSYSDALLGLLDNWTGILLVPYLLLRRSPFRSHNHAFECYSELGSYMKQLRRDKEDMRYKASAHDAPDENLLDLLVEAGSSVSDQASPLLTNEQVIGQIFTFMFAGHEANSNLVSSIITVLACYPEVQQSMQQDLDYILGSKPSNMWSYDEHYSALMQSTVGAVINETLRLFTVLPVLPKCVPPDGPWLFIDVKGKRHPLPPGTIAFINTSATHRHPTHWPERPSTTMDTERAWTDIRNDPRQRPFAVADFDPSRWTGSSKSDAVHSGSGQFLKPRPGTFIPFSDGSRGCLGRRFALIEACAVISTLFKTHSVELVTSPEDGVNMDEAWLEARRRAALALSEGTTFKMSLRVVRDVPIRFIPRGNERRQGAH